MITASGVNGIVSPNQESRYLPTKPVTAKREQQRDPADHRRQHQRQRHQRAQQPLAGETGPGQHPRQRHPDDH